MNTIPPAHTVVAGMKYVRIRWSDQFRHTSCRHANYSGESSGEFAIKGIATVFAFVAQVGKNMLVDK